MNTKFAVVLAAVGLLVGCASPAKKEFDRYASETRPQVGVTVSWSDYFEGLYSRAQTANAPANILANMNDAIFLAKQYEKGEIDKDTFDYRRRAIGAASQEIEQRRQAQAQANATNQMAAGLAMMQASGPRTLAPQASAQPSPATGIMGVLQSQSVSGTLRYCKYSNAVVNTIGSIDLCPLSIQ